MRKISDVINEIVISQPFLEEALHHGYLNLAGFSEYIRPQVEKEAQKEVSIHAIKMALSRINHPEILSPYDIHCSHGQINTMSGLKLMSILKSPNTQEIICKLHSLRGKELNSYMAITEGSREIDIFYDESFSSVIEDLVPMNLRILTLERLSLCSLQLRDEEIYQKGLFYSVTKKTRISGYQYHPSHLDIPGTRSNGTRGGSEKGSKYTPELVPVFDTTKNPLNSQESEGFFL